MGNIINNFTTLFVTRKYPPQTGGMENLSYDLIKNYNSKNYAVTFGGKQKWLPVIYPYLFLRALITCITKKIDIIHLGDGVMAPMGYVLQLLTRRKVVITAHGKDINLKFRLYQMIMPWFFRRMDKIICISNQTIEECIKVGVERSRCVFIPDGVDMKKFRVNKSVNVLRKELSERYKLDLENRKILITTGRLSERKGGLWFIQNVMLKLPENYIYIRIGPDSTEVNDLKSWLGLKKISYGEKFKKAIKDLKLEDRVFWLGRLPFDDFKGFLKISDLFIMPNIPVEGDLEGFGIVVIEAGTVGLPVIGSAIEGIKDSVVDGKTGILIETKDAKGFIRAIEKSKGSFNRDQVREEVKRRFSVEVLVDNYKKEFMNVLEN
ncbi:MAG: glycosyltransferase family 4 protein [Patescibacteria group bacterium]|nr:glycosyltransferase family 4 protein [Patescibacteria group bacterium]